MLSRSYCDVGYPTISNHPTLGGASEKSARGGGEAGERHRAVVSLGGRFGAVGCLATDCVSPPLSLSNCSTDSTQWRRKPCPIVGERLRVVARALRGGSIVPRDGRCFGVSPPLARDEVRYNLGGIVAQTLCYRGRSCERATPQLSRTCLVPLPCDGLKAGLCRVVERTLTLQGSNGAAWTQLRGGARWGYTPFSTPRTESGLLGGRKCPTFLASGRQHLDSSLSTPFTPTSKK